MTATEHLRAIISGNPVWVAITLGMAKSLLAEFDAPHQIAYGAARADIETKCTPVHDDGRAEKTAEDIHAAWYDVRQPRDPVAEYRQLWESINGAGSWAANPWVWVIEFQVLRRAPKTGQIQRNAPDMVQTAKY